MRTRRDIHTETAAKMFNVPESKVTPKQRNAAKARNFFKLYSTNTPLK